MASKSSLESFSVPMSHPGQLRLLKACRLLLGRNPTDTDFEAVGIRLGKAVGRKPYTAWYVKSLLYGKNPMTRNIEKAIDHLMAEILAEPPKATYKRVAVMVPNSFEIPEGTVVQRDARTCICGISFIPTAWNQINHSRGCAKMRARMRTRSRTG